MQGSVLRIRAFWPASGRTQVFQELRVGIRSSTTSCRTYPGIELDSNCPKSTLVQFNLIQTIGVPGPGLGRHPNKLRSL